MRWQWRADNPGRPDDNMATDEAFFHRLVRRESDTPLVRVYGWDRPSVSYGRLQDEAAVRAAYPDLPLVRRPTGGRAVLHGDDLTVAVICRADHLPAAPGGVLSSYRLLVSPVIAALNGVGVAARLGRHPAPNNGGVGSPTPSGQARPPLPKGVGASESDSGPSLSEAPLPLGEGLGRGSPLRCFDTVAACDVADPQTGRKLVGSAQRRDGGAILQQMSLPLEYLPSRDDFLKLLRDEMTRAYHVTAWELLPNL